jgi:hypothetical protein
MKLTTVLTSALLALAVNAASAADQASYDATFTAAEAARKGAAKLGFEWRDTKKMLAASQKRAAAGDFDAAITLAKRAEAQGIAGQAQAKEQAKRWQDFVVK